jgi:hypothetical protein
MGRAEEILAARERAAADQAHQAVLAQAAELKAVGEASFERVMVVTRQIVAILDQLEWPGGELQSIERPGMRPYWQQVAIWPLNVSVKERGYQLPHDFYVGSNAGLYIYLRSTHVELKELDFWGWRNSFLPEDYDTIRAGAQRRLDWLRTR